MRTSDQVNEIAKALATAQAIIKNPAKEKENPHFKSKYADLASGLDVIRPSLSANGLAFLQGTEIDGDNLVLKTRILHVSGQWIEASYPVSKIGTPHQQMGSALTYAKRQCLFALVGVCGDDDTDGNDAGEAGNHNSSDNKQAKNYPRREPPRHAPIDDSIPFMDPPSATAAQMYVTEAKKAITDWAGTAEKLKDWWADEQVYRQEAGVTKGTPEYDDLHKCFVAKGTSLAQKRAA